MWLAGRCFTSRVENQRVMVIKNNRGGEKKLFVTSSSAGQSSTTRNEPSSVQEIFPPTFFIRVAQLCADNRIRMAIGIATRE